MVNVASFKLKSLSLPNSNIPLLSVFLIFLIGIGGIEGARGIALDKPTFT
jgi:hypothetical protein